MKMATFIAQLFILAAILFWSWVQTKLNRSMLKRIEQLEELNRKEREWKWK